jgi:hypothetical protein
MNSESLKEKGPTLEAKARESQSLDAIFDAHIAKEFKSKPGRPGQKTPKEQTMTWVHLRCLPTEKKWSYENHHSF